jgi:ABC-type branched-subunit amino acid transport system substrate-binding protein
MQLLSALHRLASLVPSTSASLMLTLTLTLTAAWPAAQAQDILLGQIGPFSVIPVPDAIEVNQGIKAFIETSNKAGGIRGHKFTLFESDDRYSGDGFVTEFNSALARKPVALVSPIGSAALKRMLDDKLLDNADIVIVNAIPGAQALREPGHIKLFHIRAGDRQQIDKIVNHAQTMGMTRLSVLYQDLPIGTSGMAMAQQAATQIGGVELKGVMSGADAPALAAASKQVAAQLPQGVLILGAPRFMADGVAALRKASVSQALFALSYVPAGLVVKVAGLEGARGLGIAQTYPNPNGHTLPLQRDFQLAMKAAFPDIASYTAFHLEGYLSARTLAEALRRSKDNVASPTSLAKALRNAGEMDFGGYRVDFSKGNTGSRFVDIAVIGAEGKLRY